jgi:hypothetical protein
VTTTDMRLCEAPSARPQDTEIEIIRGQAPTSQPPLQTLADKIDWLFTHIHHSDGHEYSYQEVEAGTASLGYPVTGAYVWKLRKGQADKPNWLILRSLARFFRVPTSFFYDDHLTTDQLERAQVEVILHEPEVRAIALRVAQLDTEARQVLLSLLTYLTQHRPQASRTGRTATCN